jgi:pimeloyl-ACP methyl ester carboxylesterase
MIMFAGNAVESTALYLRNFPMIWNIFSFKTKDGLKLYGGLIKAKKATKKLVIHVHGMTDYFYDGDLVLAVARAANASGYDLMAFNNRGMGSISLIGKKFHGTSLETFEHCTRDLDAVIAAAHEMGYREIILSGHSTGCQKITYYQALKKKPEIKALILLSPADDLNLFKKNLGKRFPSLLEEARRMVERNRGTEILPPRFGTAMFSAGRFYHLLKENSVEGNIFNYEKPLKWSGKIAIPQLAVFGSEEQYAVMRPELMLEKLAAVFTHKKSRTRLIEGADHSYHGKETKITQAVKNFLTTR